MFTGFFNKHSLLTSFGCCACFLKSKRSKDILFHALWFTELERKGCSSCCGYVFLWHGKSILVHKHTQHSGGRKKGKIFRTRLLPFCSVPFRKQSSGNEREIGDQSIDHPCDQLRLGVLRLIHYGTLHLIICSITTTLRQGTIFYSRFVSFVFNQRYAFFVCFLSLNPSYNRIFMFHISSISFPRKREASIHIYKWSDANNDHR